MKLSDWRRGGKQCYVDLYIDDGYDDDDTTEKSVKKWLLSNDDIVLNETRNI